MISHFHGVTAFYLERQTRRELKRTYIIHNVYNIQRLIFRFHVGKCQSTQQTPICHFPTGPIFESAYVK